MVVDSLSAPKGFIQEATGSLTAGEGESVTHGKAQKASHTLQDTGTTCRTPSLYAHYTNREVWGDSNVYTVVVVKGAVTCVLCDAMFVKPLEFVALLLLGGA